MGPLGRAAEAEGRVTAVEYRAAGPAVDAERVGLGGKVGGVAAMVASVASARLFAACDETGAGGAKVVAAGGASNVCVLGETFGMGREGLVC